MWNIRDAFKAPCMCIHVHPCTHTCITYTQENGTIEIILFLSGKVQREENGQYLLEGKFSNE